MWIVICAQITSLSIPLDNDVVTVTIKKVKYFDPKCKSFIPLYTAYHKDMQPNGTQDEHYYEYNQYERT